MFQQCNGVATTVAGFFSGQVCSLGSAGAKRLEAAQSLRLGRTARPWPNNATSTGNASPPWKNSSRTPRNALRRPKRVEPRPRYRVRP